jgi:predicted alpha/beta hydrolase family esterase
MPVRGLFAIALVMVFGIVPTAAQCADEPQADNLGQINLAAPTLGGMQFWSDELFFHHWRIQRNSITGHYRLLDEQDVRRAWGTFEQCRSALEGTKQREKLPAMTGKAVIVLHGLGRTRSSMNGIAQFLEKTGSFEALNVSYPSTIADIDNHAQSLARIIENLKEVSEIDFVAHSLGNLVVRRYLDAAKSAGGLDPRIKRMVMLGPPNNGAQLANALDHNLISREFIGVPGRELAESWPKLSQHLATPQFEFGIIAGGKQDGHGYNPLLSGDNDMVVTVEETRLAGRETSCACRRFTHSSWTMLQCKRQQHGS